nr:sulfatase [Myxococcota bacterium]
ISVDTLRADRLGAWGYVRRTSPRIDGFSAGAVRFAWAMTPSPSTRHALPSLFTGRYPSTISRTAPPPSLAEVTRDAGYETAAVLCCQRLVAPRELRGFSSVDTGADVVRMSRAGQANADAVADAAVAWLRRPHDRPFLLWVHFYDPHHPYATPEGGVHFGDSDSDQYDAEIAFADRGIGRVLAAIDEAGLGSTAIVALTSDHGEELGEHGLRFHARSLYNQVTRVPLIVRSPDSRPSVVDRPVSLVDVMPTLLELAGVAAPPDLSGVSLAPVIRGTAPAPARPVLIELVPDRQIHRDLAAIVGDGWKAIWDREANAWSLFSLADPEDRHDRAAADPATLATWQQQLFALLDRELATTPGTAVRP